MAIIVKGNTIDNQTRCVHYHSPLDIIAIKFKCCGDYYPCYQCHAEAVNHPAVRWAYTEFDTSAILCGACATTLSIAQYKFCNYLCPNCGAAFNPKCASHDHLYFEV